MKKILVFAGTYEGRKVCEYLNDNNIKAVVCVATDYGKDIISYMQNIEIFSKRLNKEEMTDLISKNDFHMVIDATHPYAKEVTENIKASCAITKKRYFRLYRKEDTFLDCINVKNTDEAVKILQKTEGKVLLTTGSKELEKFCKIDDFNNRLVARVLPSIEVIEHCYKLGLSGKNIIAMQGPFSKEMNSSTLKQYGCKYLVTKNTGDFGGLKEKVKASHELGVKVICIHRPTKEDGYSLYELFKIISKEYNLQKSVNESYDNIVENNSCNYEDAYKTFFPLFINSKDKKVLVIGGGNIATRRVLALTKFLFNIKIVAPKISNTLKQLNYEGKIEYVEREFIKDDLEHVDFVLTATNNRKVNKEVCKLAKDKNIYVNVADKKEECEFYFPSVIHKDNLVIGVTNQGNDHHIVKEVSEKIRNML